MMKFTGLILICATSSLALLLPALGMVKFPMVDQRKMASGTIAPSLPPGQLSGRPVAVSDLGALPVDAAVANTAIPASDGQPPSLLGPPWTKQKIGLNAWIMLGPVLLLGIVLWTFAPNRGGLGR
jgi:hypothetical protein